MVRLKFDEAMNLAEKHIDVVNRLRDNPWRHSEKAYRKLLLHAILDARLCLYHAQANVSDGRVKIRSQEEQHERKQKTQAWREVPEW